MPRSVTSDGRRREEQEIPQEELPETKPPSFFQRHKKLVVGATIGLALTVTEATIGLPIGKVWRAIRNPAGYAVGESTRRAGDAIKNRMEAGAAGDRVEDEEISRKEFSSIHTVAQSQLSRALRSGKLSDYDKAAEAYEQVLGNDEATPQQKALAHYHRAQVNLQSAQLCSRNSPPDWWSTVSQEDRFYTEEAQRRYGLAREGFKAALEADPNHPHKISLLMGWGAASMGLGDRSDALEVFSRVRDSPEASDAEKMDAVQKLGEARGMPEKPIEWNYIQTGGYLKRERKPQTLPQTEEAAARETFRETSEYVDRMLFAAEKAGDLSTYDTAIDELKSMGGDDKLSADQRALALYRAAKATVDSVKAAPEGKREERLRAALEICEMLDSEAYKDTDWVQDANLLAAQAHISLGEDENAENKLRGVIKSPNAEKEEVSKAAEMLKQLNKPVPEPSAHEEPPSSRESAAPEHVGEPELESLGRSSHLLELKIKNGGTIIILSEDVEVDPATGEAKVKEGVGTVKAVIPHTEKGNYVQKKPFTPSPERVVLGSEISFDSDRIESLTVFGEKEAELLREKEISPRERAERNWRRQIQRLDRIEDLKEKQLEVQRLENQQRELMRLDREHAMEHFRRMRELRRYR